MNRTTWIDWVSIALLAAPAAADGPVAKKKVCVAPAAVACTPSAQTCVRVATAPQPQVYAAAVAAPVHALAPVAAVPALAPLAPACDPKHKNKGKSKGVVSTAPAAPTPPCAPCPPSPPCAPSSPEVGDTPAPPQAPAAKRARVLASSSSACSRRARVLRSLYSPLRHPPCSAPVPLEDCVLEARRPMRTRGTASTRRNRPARSARKKRRSPSRLGDRRAQRDVEDAQRDAEDAQRDAEEAAREAEGAAREAYEAAQAAAEEALADHRDVDVLEDLDETIAEALRHHEEALRDSVNVLSDASVREALENAGAIDAQALESLLARAHGLGYAGPPNHDEEGGARSLENVSPA